MSVLKTRSDSGQLRKVVNARNVYIAYNVMMMCVCVCVWRRFAFTS